MSKPILNISQIHYKEETFNNKEVQKAKEGLTGKGKSHVDQHYENTAGKTSGLTFLFHYLSYIFGCCGFKRAKEEDKQIQAKAQEFNLAAQNLIEAAYENVQTQITDLNTAAAVNAINTQKKADYNNALEHFEKVFEERLVEQLKNRDTLDDPIQKISVLFWGAASAIKDVADATKFPDKTKNPFARLFTEKLSLINPSPVMNDFKLRFCEKMVQDFCDQEIEKIDQKSCEEKIEELCALLSPDITKEEIENYFYSTLQTKLYSVDLRPDLSPKATEIDPEIEEKIKDEKEEQLKSLALLLSVREMDDHELFSLFADKSPYPADSKIENAKRKNDETAQGLQEAQERLNEAKKEQRAEIAENVDLEEERQRRDTLVTQALKALEGAEANNNEAQQELKRLEQEKTDLEESIKKISDRLENLEARLTEEKQAHLAFLQNIQNGTLPLEENSITLLRFERVMSLKPGYPRLDDTHHSFNLEEEDNDDRIELGSSPLPDLFVGSPIDRNKSNHVLPPIVSLPPFQMEPFPKKHAGRLSQSE